MGEGDPVCSMVDNGHIELYLPPKKDQKPGLKIRVLGTPGRGVLRFSRGGYSRPVHFLPKIAVFSKNGAI